tara:strand:+ start:47 stop:544 length:498 start_codon:yes stop_codon:yes gene_type:complete
MRVDNTIAQAHKLNVVTHLRRLNKQSYDLIWRQRPDYVSSGLNWRIVRDILLRRRTSQYVVPQICVAGAHTDIEAVLTETAADYYGQELLNIPSLYAKNGHSFNGPETLIDMHMRTGKFDYEILRNWYLYRCSTFCFGKTLPCRRMLPSLYRNTTCGIPKLCCNI